MIPSALSENQAETVPDAVRKHRRRTYGAVVSLIGKSCDQIQMLVDISKTVDLLYNPFSFSKSMVLRMDLMV